MIFKRKNETLIESFCQVDENQKYSGILNADSPQMTTSEPTQIESIFEPSIYKICYVTL